MYFDFDLAPADKGKERKLPAGIGTSLCVYIRVDNDSPDKLLNYKLGGD